MPVQFALGLDLGGTKIAGGVVSSRGQLLSSVRVPTPARGVKKDLAALFDVTRAAVRAAGIPWKSIRAVGVGVPGAVDPRAETVWAPNLPGWSRVRLRQLLQDALRRPVSVESDRNVQALAEAWLGLGANAHVQNLVFLTVGTGIGAGLISEGKLIPGGHGVAGAAGWMAIDRAWQQDYGRVGCFEALCAGPAVAKLGQRALEEDPASLMGVLATQTASGMTAEVVAQAARRGDPTACRVIEGVGTNLGLGIANLICLLNPDAVVLGGGVAGMGNLLLATIRKTVRQWGQPLARRQVRIFVSRLGDEAGVLGAARYALLRTVR